jgi:hypothetical protein
MTGSTPKAVHGRLTKANELARKAMQFAATGVNIKEPVKRFIIELEARKDIPPKMLYSVFFLVAPWDQSVRRHSASISSGPCSNSFHVLLDRLFPSEFLVLRDLCSACTRGRHIAQPTGCAYHADCNNDCWTPGS